MVQVVFQPQRDNKGPDFNSLPSRNDPSQPVPVQVGTAQTAHDRLVHGSVWAEVWHQTVSGRLIDKRCAGWIRQRCEDPEPLHRYGCAGDLPCRVGTSWMRDSCLLVQFPASWGFAGSVGSLNLGWLAEVNLHKLGGTAACELHLPALPALPTARTDGGNRRRPLTPLRCTPSAGPCNHRSLPSRR